MKPTVRPMVLDDYAECQSVLTRNGLTGSTRNEWSYVWTGNPFTEEFSDAPMGWVLELPGGSLAGTLSSIHLLFELSGRPVRAAVAASWAVDAQWRGSSVGLMARFMGQKSMGLLLNLGSSAEAARVTGALQARPVPAPGYDIARFIPVSMLAFAAAGLAKKGAPAPRLLAWLAAPVLAVRFRAPSVARADGCEVRPLDTFDGQFDSLWSRLRASSKGLVACRTRAALVWRFRGPLQAGRARILGLFRRGELEGYLVTIRSVRARYGLTGDLVADWQVAGQDSAKAAVLLDAARQTCRSTGGAALEVRGWNAWKQDVVARFRPLEQAPSTPRSYVRIPDSGLRQSLADSSLWDLSAFERF